MSEDIYTLLLSQGFLNRECDLEDKRKTRAKEKNRLKVLKKIYYEDISSESEDYTATITQTENNSYVDSVIKPDNNNYSDFLKNKFEINALVQFPTRTRHFVQIFSASSFSPSILSVSPSLLVSFSPSPLVAFSCSLVVPFSHFFLL